MPGNMGKKKQNEIIITKLSDWVLQPSCYKYRITTRYIILWREQVTS